MTEATNFNNQTLDGLRAWVGKQLDDAVDASGEPHGWSALSASDVDWEKDRPEEKASLTKGLFPRICGDKGGHIEETLTNKSMADPFEVASRVRAYWETEGWTVTDVLTEPINMYEYFRADRADGAVLTLDARETRAAVSVLSSCSIHDTVVNYLAHAGMKNVFEEELQRRELNVD